MIDVTKVVSAVVEKHKAVRRFLVLWSVTMITVVTYRVFRTPLAITYPEVYAYASVAGTLSTVLMLYHVGRSREECLPDLPPPDEDDGPSIPPGGP